MKKRFSQFLNESVSKLQTTISKNLESEVEDSIRSKADQLELLVSNISFSSGIKNTNVFLTVKGEDDNLEEFKKWFKTEF